MKFKLFFGRKPKYTSADTDKFSVKGYKCQFLMLTKGGKPVAVMEGTDPDNHWWRVQYGYSTVFFDNYTDAMNFCRSRFYSLDGKRLA